MLYRLNHMAKYVIPCSRRQSDNTYNQMRINNPGEWSCRMPKPRAVRWKGEEEIERERASHYPLIKKIAALIDSCIIVFNNAKAARRASRVIHGLSANGGNAMQFRSAALCAGVSRNNTAALVAYDLANLAPLAHTSSTGGKTKQRNRSNHRQSVSIGPESHYAIGKMSVFLFLSFPLGCFDARGESMYE